MKDFIDSHSSKEDATAPIPGMDDEQAQAFRRLAQQMRALTSERVRVSRILVKVAADAPPSAAKRARQAAEDIRLKLLSGDSFASVARADSDDTESAARGGDIGYVVRGIAPPAFEKAAFSLPIGKISEPIQTPSGFNVIEVTEKVSAEAPDFSRFKDDLSKALASMNFQTALERYVQGLKVAASIERNPDIMGSIQAAASPAESTKGDKAASSPAPWWQKASGH